MAAFAVRPLRHLFSSLNCIPLKVEALLLVDTRIDDVSVPGPESCTDAIARLNRKEEYIELREMM